MRYQNKRGGRIILTDIRKPEKNEWGSATEAMEAALELEKQVNEVNIGFFFSILSIFLPVTFPSTQSLLNINTIATEQQDANFCDFLESEYLQEQVDAIKEISNHVTNLRRVGEGLGVFIFDKELHEADK
jgi:ferritin heavy chain